MQVDNKDVLNCYYAQSEEADGLQVCIPALQAALIFCHNMLEKLHTLFSLLQRRCYWLLEGDGNTVLVHYLAAQQCDRLLIANDLTDHADPSLTESHEVMLLPSAGL